MSLVNQIIPALLNWQCKCRVLGVACENSDETESNPTINLSFDDQGKLYLSKGETVDNNTVFEESDCESDTDSGSDSESEEDEFIILSQQSTDPIITIGEENGSEAEEDLEYHQV